MVAAARERAGAAAASAEQAALQRQVLEEERERALQRALEGVRSSTTTRRGPVDAS